MRNICIPNCFNMLGNYSHLLGRNCTLPTNIVSLHTSHLAEVYTVGRRMLLLYYNRQTLLRSSISGGGIFTVSLFSTRTKRRCEFFYVSMVAYLLKLNLQNIKFNFLMDGMNEHRFTTHVWSHEGHGSTCALHVCLNMSITYFWQQYRLYLCSFFLSSLTLVFMSSKHWQYPIF